ncbi:MAG: hypothetical protein M1826_006563 [Phylliscum demangeonii]|nr:MAG: hypothetical protein M1826_006563 [Phylliscum demangeonii]
MSSPRLLTFFASCLHEDLRDGLEGSRGLLLRPYVIDHVRKHHPTPRVLDGRAAHAVAFIHAVTPIFSSSYRLQLLDNLQRFSVVADDAGTIADTFLSELRVVQWVEYLVDHILRVTRPDDRSRWSPVKSATRATAKFAKALRATSSGLNRQTDLIVSPAAPTTSSPSRPSKKGGAAGFSPSRDPSSPSHSPSTPKKGKAASGKRPDSLSPGAPPSPDAPPSETADDIIQIRLQGPNLKVAWLANRVTRSWIPPPANWNPSVPSALFCYHGMAVDASDSEIPQDIFRFGLRTAFGQRNELVPGGSIHISFSAVRSFLWAVFRAELVEIVSNENQTSRLQQPWAVHGRTYNGIMMLQFTLPLPLQDPLQQAVLTQEQAELWVGLLDRPRIRDVMWNENRSVHGSSLTRFPDLIHASELAKTERNLASWTGRSLLRRPIWRSAVATEAGETLLNGRRSAVFAVSFEQTAFSLGRIVQDQFFCDDYIHLPVLRGLSATVIAGSAHALLSSDDNDRGRISDLFVLALAQRLLKVLLSVFPPDQPESTFLCHDLLSMENILVDEHGVVTAVLNYHYVSTLPLWRPCKRANRFRRQPRRDPPLQGECLLDGNENDDGHPTVNSLYWEQQRDFEVTKLRSTYLDEMQLLCPHWIQVMHQSQLQSDLENTVKWSDLQIGASRTHQ